MHQILSSAGYTGEGRLGRRASTNQLTKIPTEIPPVLMFACGWKHNIFLTKEHQIFVCGENTEGQLGPAQGTCLEPTLSKPLSDLKPIWVSCGDKITAILTENYSVYVCGFEWGSEPVQLIPSVDNQVQIVYIACGVDNICGISTDGKLYVWYRKSQLAKLCECQDVLCDVAAGKNQIFGLATNGNLWVMGHSKTCGMGRKWSSLTLSKVSVGEGVKIKRIFAYSLMSIAIDVEGKVYVCGTNNYGELGIPNMKKANTFQHLAALDGKPVIHATIGDTFVAYITEDFELYTCGDGDEYRLCNLRIDKVSVPSKATAAEGHKIMWACAGCSHIILAEGLEEFPIHPGREYFKLEGTMKLRKKKFNPQMQEIVVQGQAISVDTTDRGTIWTCFLPGDEVSYMDSNMTVVGCTTNSIVLKKGDEYFMQNVKNIIDLHNKIKLIRREGADLKEFTTRSGLNAKFDVTPSAVRAFGYAPFDEVVDIFGSHATVVGVLGGSIWFKYQDDDKLVTLSADDVSMIHESMKITKAHERSVEYTDINGHSLPVEVSPCSLLEHFDLMLNDLVECFSKNKIGNIVGSFRQFVVISDALTHKMFLATPNEVMILRRFSTKPTLIKHLSNSRCYKSVNVSCQETDEFMPFDRVLANKVFATVIGRASESSEDNCWWILPDEAAALGSGLFLTKQPFLKLLRRVSSTKVVYNGIDVSTSALPNTGLLPGDIITLNNVDRFTVVGEKEGKIVLDAEETEIQVFPNELKDASIVYRADLPAKRLYYSSSGNGLYVSVSSKDFFGFRFLPDDVIKTSLGIGLVIGMAGPDLCIHMNEKKGVVFFPARISLNTKLNKLVERRSIKGVFTQNK